MTEGNIRLGEVCLLTDAVPRLANFYKTLLGVDDFSDDPVHQFVLTDGVALTVYHDGSLRGQASQTIQLAFTVEDLEAQAERIKTLGAQIVSPPTLQPWGAKNMSFLDPAGNLVYLRSFPHKAKEKE